VTGRRYAAGDPALLLWVHAALVDSGLAAGRAFGTPLSAGDGDVYVAEMVAGELAGVPRPLVPASVAELERYVASVRPGLSCTPAAAESMACLLDPPGLDEEVAGFWRDVRDAAIAVLPQWARQALQIAEDVAGTPGAVKGVMMKIGQMASCVDGGLSPAVRRALARLQDSVPPMSPALAAAVVAEELGVPPERAFARWDPRPVAAASIGQVHRAVTLDGRAVAVKVQYPGIAETIAADLRDVALIRRMLRIAAPAQDVDALLGELRDRIGEELGYRREAASQHLMAACYHGHPTIRIPAIIDGLSTGRVITSELPGGARFAELASWPQRERDLAAETIYRFVFRSLYEAGAFNGDPHPGSYLFHRGGQVTFLDVGLVRRFTPAELRPLLAMARTICVEHDPEAFRASLENAGFLRPGAPLRTQEITGHLAVFYDTIREPGPVTITSAYAASVVRGFFDLRSPVAQYIAVPRPYVILQRINLGLFAVLGELPATADWRAIAEEIWPFVRGPASTPMGRAEAAWRARRPAMAA
jgi:ABC1 atypical kinase-like domain/ER-bound oxygenase mpaB/B'/Rubber oxygenase, catalytic domain